MKLQSRRHSSGKILIKAVQTSKTKQQHTSYLWDGNRQLQQNTATHTHTIIYEQDSFEPVAQFIWLRDGLTAANDEPESYQENQEGWYGDNKPVIKTGVQLYHYHNDHLGTPNELTDQQGDVVWYADYEAWGNTAKVEWREQVIDNVKVSQDELQPIRFQGQSFDTETGLHYNRFRYFDPDLGMFTTRDPIGLMGGNNVFQYAPNPVGWIDPFGLSGQGGGSYGHTRAISVGGEVNHMPASASSKAGGSGVSHYRGPATWMSTADHRQTASWGNRSTSRQWRIVQSDLISRNKFGKAMEMDIKDVTRKFGNKYNKGMREMIDYAIDKDYVSRAEGNRLKRRYLKCL